MALQGFSSVGSGLVIGVEDVRGLEVSAVSGLSGLGVFEECPGLCGDGGLGCKPLCSRCRPQSMAESRYNYPRCVGGACWLRVLRIGIRLLPQSLGTTDVCGLVAIWGLGFRVWGGIRVVKR